MTRKAGKDKVHFHGSLPHHHKLAPGTYSVKIIASNVYGSASKSLTFTILS